MVTEPAEQQVANPYYTYGILYLSHNFRQWEQSKGPRYREYRRAWAQRPQQRDHGEFPLNINLEVTTRCNLACTFCSQPSLTKEQLGDMPWELYTKVIDEGERYHVAAANLNGLGEPLLLRQLPRMIGYAKQHGFIDVMFHTNGTVMTDAIANALIDAGLDRIIFSVDSPDQQTYEEMRIGSNWKRVVANVRRFAEVRNGLGRSVPIIRTTMVVTDKTAHQVRGFVSLWKPLADQITLQDLTWRTKVLENGEWSNREQSAIPVEMDEVREEAIRRKVSFVCPYLYQSAYAFWNGDVIPCSNPNARKHMIMGQLEQQSLHEVWQGKTYQDLRQLHASGRWYEHPVCRSCEIPLIELYKALEHQGVTFEGEPRAVGTPTQPGAVAPLPALPVASEMAPEGETQGDLVMQFQNQSATPTTAEPMRQATEGHVGKPLPVIQNPPAHQGCSCAHPQKDEDAGGSCCQR